jgi:hypothetical protein
MEAKPSRPASTPIGSMSLQLAIPWQVALLQSLPPLHQPASFSRQPAETVNRHHKKVEEFSSSRMRNFQPVLTTEGARPNQVGLRHEKAPSLIHDNAVSRCCSLPFRAAPGSVLPQCLGFRLHSRGVRTDLSRRKAPHENVDVISASVWCEGRNSMQLRSDALGKVLLSYSDRLCGLDRIVIERDLRRPIPVISAKFYLQSSRGASGDRVARAMPVGRALQLCKEFQ